MGQSINCSSCDMIETDSPKGSYAAIDDHDAEIKPKTIKKRTHTYTLYVLHLAQEKHYVDVTTNFVIDYYMDRNQDHDWIKLYPVKSFSILKQQTCKIDLDKEVLKCMAVYGRDNVRGGSYTGVNLTTDQLAFLRKTGL